MDRSEPTTEVAAEGLVRCITEHCSTKHFQPEQAMWKKRTVIFLQRIPNAIPTG
jgi:hypothetical protein